MNKVYFCFPGGRHKAVTFSYDDGRLQDRRLVEMFNRYGVKGTFNLNGAQLGKDGTDWRLTPGEIRRAILEKGFEIANHGADHRANGLLRPIEGIREVLDCRLELEKAFGRIVRGMAYPDSGINLFQNGASRESVKRYLEDLDIVYARTTVSDPSFRLPEAEGGPVRNWFLEEDSFRREGYFSLEDTANDLLEDPAARKVLETYVPALVRVMTEQSVIPLGLSMKSILNHDRDDSLDLKQINHDLNQIPNA